MLLKSAYTSVAASLNDGKMTHTISMISQSGWPMSKTTKAKLQQLWKYYTYLIINEFSMLAKTFFAKLSCNISIGKGAGGSDWSGVLFSGINVILCGNLHQFPPIPMAGSEALYYPINFTTNSIDVQVGCMIYEEFNTVVILQEQNHVMAHVWHDFLQHLCNGHVQPHHIGMLCTLLIHELQGTPANFNLGPWDDVSLVTPCHMVQKLWNEAAVQKHCCWTGKQLFICTPEDRIRNRSLILAERCTVINWYCVDLEMNNRKKKWHHDLPDVIELMVGMKVMVTQNIETDLDITNSARGK